jgi:3-hydroxyisobutyrate dehydrogenase-like beta-hydroxyacid dehydrogenase
VRAVVIGAPRVGRPGQGEPLGGGDGVQAADRRRHDLRADAVAGDFAPATPVDLIYKDLGIIRRCAREGDVRLRLGELANGLYEAARERGLGASDMSAVSTLWERA